MTIITPLDSRHDRYRWAVLLPLNVTPRLPDVESRRLKNGYGYIIIRSFSDQAPIDAVDAALLGLRDTPGLIIDVRQNGKGDAAVTQPILGRFIAKKDLMPACDYATASI